MVGVGPGGVESSLARVTVIDWFGQVVLDAYVKQSRPITDYRTFVSGITEQDLKDATLSLQQCRAMVFQLLQNRILVGHALKNDLTVLGIAHPWWLLRDTAKYEPFMKVRVGHKDGVLWPRKLKDLVREKLDQDIQVYGRPHSPYEDALGALDLYKSVQTHWEQMAHYKVLKANEIHQQHQKIHQQQQIRLLDQRRRQYQMSQQQPQSVQ
jgi:RNA exonuclease 4